MTSQKLSLHNMITKRIDLYNAWCANLSIWGFRTPLQGNVSDEIASIQVTIGIKHVGSEALRSY